MKLIDEVKINAPNAWGKDTKTTHYFYKVDESDVNVKVPHWGGYKRPEYTIKHSDVGKVFVRIRDDKDVNYMCWYEGTIRD